MKQLRRTVILLIILCMGTCFAYAQTKGSSISASTVFGPLDGGEASWPKAKLGVSLKKNGFAFESETQKKENIYGEIKTLHTKIYKKGDFSIEYTYYMDSENDPFFLSLKINFPTAVACESFYKEVVKRVKDDEKYWDNVPGGFPRGEWDYKKNECERRYFGPFGESNQFWRCEGKNFTYWYKEIPVNN